MPSLMDRVRASIGDWMENNEAYNLALLEGRHETYRHDCTGAKE
jgi:hypothetical protein